MKRLMCTSEVCVPDLFCLHYIKIRKFIVSVWNYKKLRYFYYFKLHFLFDVYQLTISSFVKSYFKFYYIFAKKFVSIFAHVLRNTEWKFRNLTSEEIFKSEIFKILGFAVLKKCRVKILACELYIFFWKLSLLGILTMRIAKL